MNRIIRNGTARVPDMTMYRPQRAASLKGKIPVKTISAAALALGLALPALAHEAPIHAHAELVPIPTYNLPFGAASAAASLQAAEAFLANFDEATKAQFMFDLNSMEREGWSNLPARFVTRAGISVGDLSDGQRKLLFDFLASSLGEEGYQSVKEVMAAEAFLSGNWFAFLVHEMGTRELLDFFLWHPIPNISLGMAVRRASPGVEFNRGKQPRQNHVTQLCRDRARDL